MTPAQLQRPGAPRIAQRPIVLTLAGSYYPGFKSGGPGKSLLGLVEHLGSEFAFRVLTSDRDQGDTCSYPGIRTNQWTEVGNARVYYITPDQMTLRGLWQVISSTPHDAMYLNSFFNPLFSIWPLLLRRFAWVKQPPVIVAPRGEFSPAALRIKAAKKHVFLAVAGLSGLYRNINWQASSPFELKDIQHWFRPGCLVTGRSARFYVAPDLVPTAVCTAVVPERSRKKAGALRVIFLSRVCPIKNLDYALSVLRMVRGTISLDIYGPIAPSATDQGYWVRCQELASTMPSHVTVVYHGPLDPTQVPGAFAAHDVLLLPTRGESFGHAIFEALRAGCPVVTSDKTPWRSLEMARAGWDIPLDQLDRFQLVLQGLADMDAEQHAILVAGALKLASRIVADTEPIEQHRRLLDDVCTGTGPSHTDGSELLQGV